MAGGQRHRAGTAQDARRGRGRAACQQQDARRSREESAHRVQGTAVDTRHPLPRNLRPRPVVGLLLDALYNEYASMVVGAFDAECARRGLDLICFAGGSLHSPAGYERQRNRCFDLAGEEALDGLVVLSLSTTASVMKEFLDSFQELAICSV